MKKFHENAFKGLTYSVSALALVMSASAFAQDTNPEEEETTTENTDEDQVDVTDTGATGSQEGAPIVVTGSRIKKSTYSSISPLQVITTEASQDTGLFDPAQLLQRDESASGQQIDATFQGFVLNNGPGSQTLNLRGLGADRTLLLINGRRLAPAGVEGAPVNPSINLLPSSLIDRFDLLLDGASSVYGSDAVAGVTNIILRKDFDGPELFASGNINPQGGGDDYQVSGAWGFNSDRGFFGIGAEYAYRDEVKLRDRDFLAGCDTHYEITDSGEIRTVDLRSNATVQNRTPGVSVSESPCKISGISGRIFVPFTNYGSIYFQDGNSNTGIPNFNESTIGGVDVDANGDGIRDVDFQNVNNNAANIDQTFISQQKLYNVMAYGEYTFPGDANITPFFEANYTRAEIFSENTGTPQIFPSVPDSNPFNPCNPAAPGGVDCRAAENATFGTGLGGIGALPASPIFTIRGDRNNVDIVQEQYRGVLGFKGDLPFISPSWTFEVSGTYSKSKGSSVRNGVREDKLAFALGIDPTADFDGDGIVDNTGDGIADDYDQNVDFADNPILQAVIGLSAPITPCDASALANPSLAMPDLTTGCVPVNLFAPSVLGTTIGDFASQAERDYVFGVRSFDTEYEQLLLSGYITGNLFDLPAGPVGAVFGLEYRKDKIDSTPNVEAANGLLFAFFSDRGAVGSKDIKEAYGEIDVPLQAGKPWVEELNLKLAGRVTDEEFYGTNFTYSIAAGWRPISSLQLKFTYGTSFRAPNLRENFLQGQSGFPTIIDPCAVPNAAFVNNVYVPNLDTRDPTTLANCVREGRDPTSVGIDQQGLNTIQTTSAEATSGGTLDLNPETSRSLTAGFAFEETFGDGFDVALAVGYYDIKLKDSIITPSSQFIVNDCFTRDDGTRSPFCDRLSYGTAPASRFLISNIDSGFINLNQESVRGVDINATFGKEVPMFGTLVDLGLNIRANHLIERSNIFIDDNGNSSFDEDAGEFGFPSWTGRATFTADIDNFRFTWQTRWIGDVEQQANGIDPLDDAFGNQGTGFLGDTCTGAGTANVAGDGALCRDVGFANDYFVHTVALRYRTANYTFRAGITNLFDRDPPLVDSNEVFAVSNTPIGNGYNLDGREFFLSATVNF